MNLERFLAELLTEPVEAARLRSEREFDRIAAPVQNRIVICGTGRLGELTLAGLRGAGIEPLAFCDNQPKLWGSSKESVEIMRLSDAIARFNGSAAFIVASYNSSTARKQLRELGCRRIVPYPVMFWKHWRTMPGEDRLELPHRVMARASEMSAGYNLLSDERSRREFQAQVRWRCLLDYDCLPPHDPPRNRYFPADLFALSPSEVYVDCRATDGESIQAFLAASGGRFGKIYAWESDRCGELRDFCENLHLDIGERVDILPYAAGASDEKGRARNGDGDPAPDSSGGDDGPHRALDNVLAGAFPTFIKMDLERAGHEALRGASLTMECCRPVMALRAHKCAHLWELPQWLKAGNPDYQIFLRRYAEDCWETVVYAIPPERLRVREQAHAAQA